MRILLHLLEQPHRELDLRFHHLEHALQGPHDLVCHLLHLILDVLVIAVLGDSLLRCEGDQDADEAVDKARNHAVRVCEGVEPDEEEDENQAEEDSENEDLDDDRGDREPLVAHRLLDVLVDEYIQQLDRDILDLPLLGRHPLTNRSLHPRLKLDELCVKRSTARHYPDEGNAVGCEVGGLDEDSKKDEEHHHEHPHDSHRCHEEEQEVEDMPQNTPRQCVRHSKVVQANLQHGDPEVNVDQDGENDGDLQYSVNLRQAPAHVRAELALGCAVRRRYLRRNDVDDDDRSNCHRNLDHDKLEL
mmetsp:Transcript_59875/g.141011  ORF Transcript_59875/g.141011 Transcript_59875/m.141011 type:complete len:302 (-) Transcript_59875:7071-7976(-)